MKINLVLICVIMLLLLVSSIDSSAKTASKKDIFQVIPTLRPTIMPTLTPTPTPPFPARLAIPGLGIDTAVEPVGNDENGTMMLPQSSDKVGWYQHGYKPGERGNAVIGGHLDLSTGAPAIFYNLGALQIGNSIEVLDEFGIQRTFTVVRIESYLYDEIPLEDVFGENDHAHLNLKTCSGVFNQREQNYTHRLVIYTELSR